MNELVKELAYLRIVTEDYKGRLAEIEADIVAVYGERLEKAKHILRLARDEEAEVYEKLRSAGVEAYQDTGEKQPHPAVKIGEYATYEYDTAEAVDWLIEKKLPKALKLDAKQFKKFAETHEPDFVTITKEARAKVSSDLSEYLEV